MVVLRGAVELTGKLVHAGRALKGTTLELLVQSGAFVRGQHPVVQGAECSGLPFLRVCAAVDYLL